MSWVTNIYLWMGLTFVFLTLFIILFILLWFLGKKTHAIKELKAFISGKPLAYFFEENRRMSVVPVKPEGGIVEQE